MRKADFNAEEWATVLQGPPMAGLRVIAADRGGTIRESVSMAKVYAEARQQRGENALLDEILADAPQVRPQDAGSPENLPQLAMQHLREALAVLDGKGSPEDTEAYKGFVRELAQRVAESHREGGILGIGGKPVSESEQAALDEIAATLDAGASATDTP